MSSKKSLPKFIIIGPDTTNTQDLLSEIRRRGYQGQLFKLHNISFAFVESVFIAKHVNIDLSSFDIFIFRGYNKNLLFAQILAKNLLAQNKIILDDILSKNYLPGKIAEAAIFSQKHLPHPKTYQLLSHTNYKKLLPQIGFPIIVKPVDGQKGQNIEKFNTPESALAFFQRNPRGFLIQEYLPIDGDIRVFIVNGKILGAIKRLVITGDYRSNASLGADAEKIIPTREMEVLALQAVAAMGYEIAGVDLIEYNNQLYILEVNITPQWQKFKEVTGVNPAEHIINYAIEKYEKN
ncbi:MAG: RimK family alpha-L-glutamate ligase [Parcubacteria group bacterium]|jgi:ribosomal protein S6--L-glutamate ligase